jgi:uncharacterized membrane protein YkvA (DUF1232 family)
MWWHLLIAILSGLVVLYAVLLGLLFVASRRTSRALGFKEAMRLLPDVLRLVRRLAGDSGLPRGLRIRLGLVVVYLASPIDLVPDFIPVLGYADDAIVIAVALRSVVRIAGPEALARHWPGTPDGLWAVKQLAGVGDESGSDSGAEYPAAP